jgi:hypothetical protein
MNYEPGDEVTIEERGVLPALSGRYLSDVARIVPTPLTAASPGVPGQVSYDDGFFYQCTAANVWRRVAIAAW